MPRHEPRVLLDGLHFPESLRWRGDKLYFSDFYAHEVVAVDLGGRRETLVEVPEQPGGLGFMPDGSLLVVSMLDSRLLRWANGTLTQVADLSEFAYSCNDMVVDPRGRAYIGEMLPLDVDDPSTMGRPSNLVLVEPDSGEPNGGARVVANKLRMPNGAVITPDGSTLIVAESFDNKLTSFRIEADGSLTDRAIFAELDGIVSDGICLDAEGCVWVAVIIPDEKAGFQRVAPGGAVVDRIDMESGAGAAVALGGLDGHTLFLAESLSTDWASRSHMQKGNGRVRILEVDVPAAPQAI